MRGEFAAERRARQHRWMEGRRAQWGKSESAGREYGVQGKQNA